MNKNFGPVPTSETDVELTPHWLKREPIGNYGDLLSELLIDRLFELPVTTHVLRVIGSCLADDFVPNDPPAGRPIVFWGCGARDENGLGHAARARIEIPSVRGPLTRSVLRLGAGVPIGDTALLLPLIHAPPARPASPRALLVPHFHDTRTDEALRIASGADAVLRPNLRSSPLAVLDFIDSVARASFVLAGSLHAAITAAAYEVPFAFWDSGAIDLPFKWRDFAASVGVACAFHPTLADGRAWFTREAAPALSLPPLWPMLAVAPVSVRPKLLVDAISRDVRRHGPAVLDDVATPRGQIRMIQGRLASLREDHRFRAEIDALLKDVPAADDADADAAEAGACDVSPVPSATTVERLQALLAELRAARVAASAVVEQGEPPSGTVPEAAGDPSDFEVRKLESFLDDRQRHVDALEGLIRSQADIIERLESERERLVPDAIASHVQGLQLRLTSVERERDAILASAVWRVAIRLRRIVFRYPRLGTAARRTLKLVWWLISFRLPSRLNQRRRLRRDLESVRESALFHPAYYAARYADTIPAGTDLPLHYALFGGRSGLDPHPLFDAAFYRSQAPSANPLAHYLSNPLGSDPHPLFDTACYLSRFAAPLPAGQTPLGHFVAAGDAAASPNPIFETRMYLSEYPEAANHPGGPLAHYVEIGEASGFAPHPLFDPSWYSARHPERDGLGPLAHYLRHGHGTGMPGSALAETLGERFRTLPHRLAFPDTAAPEISIIVPTYGHLHDTWRCLATIMTHTGDLAYEVIVVDDRPQAPIAPLLDGDNLRVHRNAENLGFLRSCNAAAKRARGRLLVFLNNDTTVGRDWLRPMASLIGDDPRVGMVGCKLLNTDGTIQEAGGIIHSNGWGFPYGSGDDPSLGAYNYIREVDVVTGACFLVRRDLFEMVGGFDDRYAPAFYEEFDLATALRDRGYRVVYQPASVVTHHGSASYGIEARDWNTARNHAKFCAKWRTLLATQPAEGDSLFLARERPSLRGVILVVDDKVPEYDKHAGGVTLLQYLELMREIGLKVVFHPQDATPLQPYTDALQRRGIEVLHAPETLATWLRQNGRHLDYVWTARPYVTAPILDQIKKYTGAPILYYTHDLHYLRERRRYELDGSLWALEESQRLKPMELGIFLAVDRVMTPSAEEARIIAAEVSDAHVTVVPPYLFGDSAVDPERLDFAGKSDVVFVGGFDHTPNVDAAQWLAGEIMPLVWAARPEVKALIIGNAPPEEVGALAGPRVEVTGFVPSLDPFYARARLSVSPLRYGAGVKGKIVGALQAGVPVVTTGCGNEGIQLRDGEQALIGETAAEIATAMLALLNDDALCRRFALAGAEVVRTRFSKERARNVLLSLLGDDLCPVCGARPRHSRIAPGANWRESFSCMTCLTLNRTAALAQILLSPWHRQRVGCVHDLLPLLEGLRIHEFSLGGPIRNELSALPGFSSSEFFDDVASGEVGPNGSMCQDIQNLSFPDASVDLLISQDVMEHVPDPERGFSELFRVLRPGGRHVFTIPYSPNVPDTVQRAVVEDNVVRHILPPEYHGDPIRAEGALVFSDYGADLVGRLHRIGYAVALHEVGPPDDPRRQVLVFETVRPA